MSFLKNTLGLAEKFLDGLDKTESSKATPSHHPPTPERPLFPRRSASHAVEGQITPPTSTGRSFSIPLEGINSIDVSAKDDAPLAPRSAGSGSGAPDLPFAGNAGAVSSSAEAGLPATEDPRPSRASSGADSGQDTHAHVPRPCRSSSHAHDPGDASAVLMNAVKDKEVKILHLTEAVEQLRREKADLEADLSDREADLTAALSDLDRARRTIASLEQQIKDSYAEAAAARARVEALQEELAGCDPRVSVQLEGNLDGLRAEVEGLKAQLARAETSRSQLQDQLTASRSYSQRREDELLAENKELAAALAAAEVLASSGPSSGGNATHLAAMEVELESHIRREAAAAAEKEMLEERRLSSERLRQLEQVTQQLHVSHDSLDKAKAELAAVRAERDATVTKLRAELAAASASLKDNRTAQLETRLTSLADSLLEKQGVIDQLISEKSSLSQRLEVERSRRREAEERITALMSSAAGMGGEDVDVEEGWSSTTPSRKAGKRGSGSVPLTRIEALSKHPGVAAAADTVDAFCIRSGRFLGVNPHARLLFFLYLLLLHLWALFILSFHTHSLDSAAGGAIVSPTGQVLSP